MATAGLGPALEVYLLGQVDYEECLALQQRLVYELSGRDDGQSALLICEHANLITVGRSGSWSHIRCDERERASRQLEVRWVNRGGGCVLHGLGQLAIYPIVPLAWHRLPVGQFLSRFHEGLLAALGEQGIQGKGRAGSFDIWGRTGQLATLGLAVKHWTTYHGAYLNVCPDIDRQRLVQSDARGLTEASTLHLERQQPIRMSKLREALVRRLAAAWGLSRYHLYTGHPLLRSTAVTNHEPAARAG